MILRKKRQYAILCAGVLGLIFMYISSYERMKRKINEFMAPKTCSKEYILENLKINNSLRDLSNPCYISYPSKTPLNIHCETCSVVMPSGHLIGKAKGREIDSHDCVIRSNNAPTNGYEKDVGFRTTMRMSSENLMRATWKQFNNEYDSGKPLLDRLYIHGTILVQYGIPFDDQTKKVMMERWPDLQFYFLNKIRQDITMERFRETVKSGMPTNGFRTIHYVEDFCDEIFIYGLTRPGHCIRVQSNLISDLVYNYYSDDGRTECEVHRKMKSIHNFDAEKQIIKKYLKKQKNYHFIEPEW